MAESHKYDSPTATPWGKTATPWEMKNKIKNLIYIPQNECKNSSNAISICFPCAFQHVFYTSCHFLMIFY